MSLEKRKIFIHADSVRKYILPHIFDICLPINSGLQIKNIEVKKESIKNIFLFIYADQCVSDNIEYFFSVIFHRHFNWYFITLLYTLLPSLWKQKLYDFLCNKCASITICMIYWVFTSLKIRKWLDLFQTVGTEMKSRESFRKSYHILPRHRSFIFLISVVHKLIHPLPLNVAQT